METENVKVVVSQNPCWMLLWKFKQMLLMSHTVKIRKKNDLNIHGKCYSISVALTFNIKFMYKIAQTNVSYLHSMGPQK